MKTHSSISTTNRALRDALLCVSLWVLALQLPAADLGQKGVGSPRGHIASVLHRV
jgi:hypothetical protein